VVFGHESSSSVHVAGHCAQEVAVAARDGQWWSACDDPRHPRRELITEGKRAEPAITQVPNCRDPGRCLLRQRARNDRVEIVFGSGPCLLQTAHLSVGDEVDVSIDQPGQKSPVDVRHRAVRGKITAKGLHPEDQAPVENNRHALREEGHAIESHSRSKRAQTHAHDPQYVGLEAFTPSHI
jgi:hypothetical protein